MVKPVERTTQRRKAVYIDKDFQVRFILKFSGLVAAGSGVTMIVLYFLTRFSNTVAIVKSRVVVTSTADYILPLLFQTVIIVTAVVGIAAFFVTLYVSNRIAGPLYRFKQVFRELGQGNFTNQVKLRKNDQLQEVAGEFNQMITSVRNQVHISIGALEQIREDVEAVGESNVEESKRRKFMDIRLRLQQLEDALRFFRT